MYVVDMAPVDLAEVARACAQGSLAAANKAGVTIVQDFAPHLPHVLGDAKRLGQVFDNLIGNAIKFSPNGGVVTVRLLWQYDKVQVRIRDTGIGIPKDNLNKIWDRFYQIDSTSTRRFAGTAFLRLSESIDLHDIDPADVPVPVTVFAARSDQLVPVEDTRAFAVAVPLLHRYHEIDSVYGHDAFLKEDARVHDVLVDALGACGGAA